MYNTFKQVRNLTNQAVRRERLAYKSTMVDRERINSFSSWELIQKFDNPKNIDNSNKELSIDGYTGDALVNHMAEYIFKRAKLVSEDDIKSHRSFLPLRNPESTKILDLDETEIFLVDDLYKSETPSLACGPDTISHRHIIDLLPAIREPLQLALDKPILKITDTESNFNRLISKEKITKDSVLTVKSVRPIAELNVLQKYGPIRIFMKQFRDLISPKLVPNQYSLPGKGCPMAIVEILDNSAVQIAKNKPVFVVF